MNALNKTILLLAVSLASVSCNINEWGWGGYNPEGSEYIYYSDDIRDKCIRRPVTTLDYVMKVIETIDDITDNGAYVIPDGMGGKVGPIVCTVIGKDTCWTYDNMRYQVTRSEADPQVWQVSRHDDDYDWNGFKYDFVMTARLESGKPEGGYHYPWTITLAGERLEDSEYSLSYRIEDTVKVGWVNSDYFDGEGLLLYGQLNLSFRKNGRELDWVKATYYGDYAGYQTSFK